MKKLPHFFKKFVTFLLLLAFTTTSSAPHFIDSLAAPSAFKKNLTFKAKPENLPNLSNELLRCDGTLYSIYSVFGGHDLEKEAKAKIKIIDPIVKLAREQKKKIIFMIEGIFQHCNYWYIETTWRFYDMTNENIFGLSPDPEKLKKYRECLKKTFQNNTEFSDGLLEGKKNNPYGKALFEYLNNNSDIIQEVFIEWEFLDTDMAVEQAIILGQIKYLTVEILNSLFLRDSNIPDMAKKLLTLIAQGCLSRDKILLESIQKKMNSDSIIISERGAAHFHFFEKVPNHKSLFDPAVNNRNFERKIRTKFKQIIADNNFFNSVENKSLLIQFLASFLAGAYRSESADIVPISEMLLKKIEKALNVNGLKNDSPILEIGALDPLNNLNQYHLLLEESK